MAAVTIKDIAEQLGVSPATVSLALNGRHGVNEDTRNSVLNLAKQLGYRSAASKRIASQLGNINFLIYRKSGRILTNTQFFTRLIEAVEKAARAHSCQLTIIYCNGQEQLSSCIDEAVAGQSLGILMLGTEMEQDDLPFVENAPLPIVVLDNELSGSTLDMVSIHNFDGVWRAVAYLFEHGWQDIGYLRSCVPITNFEMRYMAYAYALHHFGSELDTEKVYELAPTLEDAQKDMQRLLKQGAKIPRALIADNDLIALGAARALQEAGLRIPEDVALIGFDNIPLAEFFQPSLSSIEVSCKDLGQRAVEALLWRIKNSKATPQNTAIGTKLILRESTKRMEDNTSSGSTGSSESIDSIGNAEYAASLEDN